MEIQLWQIIILTCYGILAIWDQLGLYIGLSSPAVAGLFTGIVMNDIQTGLLVGATLQLMILGVGTYGGASIPDYLTGAIIGTAFAISSGQGMEFGLEIAIPVGLLMIQLDVLTRSINIYLQHLAEKKAEQCNYTFIERINLFGFVIWGISRALPIFICLFFGQGLVEIILNNTPEWITTGLSIAGGLLPAVGIAILLHYLNLKKYWVYIVFGFTLSAYLSLPLLGIAFIGLVFAVQKYQQNDDVLPKTEANEGGIIDYDE